MIDIRAHYAGWVMTCAEFYAKDLEAMTQEQFDKTYGGATRSPRNFSAEVALLTANSVNLVKGGEMPGRDPEAMAAKEAELSTPALAGAAVKSAALEMAKAFKEASDEQIAREVMMPWGQSMTIFALAHLVSSHIMYHDAQLNYVQAINGDGEMHWF